jgi:hypothetical protein
MYTIANIRPLGHNIGNHAIHFALRHMLYETFGRLVSIIDYPATSRHESTAKGGITAATVHEINRFADGVIVGGGNLYENNEIAVDEVALSALQPPLMLFSNSRGRIYDRNGILVERSDVIPDSKLKSLINRADISLSRDSATREYATSLGLIDEIGYCPTINLGRYSDSLPELPELEDVGALISIRTPALMNVPYRYQNQIQHQIELTIDSLRQAGHKRIRILCNDSRDLDFASSFRYSMQVDSLFTNDVYQYLALLKNASLVISYRLHATLPAIAYGTPTVNITYDERAISLFNDLGIADATLNMVKLGDAFANRLKYWIESGGYSVSSSDQIHKNWKLIGDFQFEKLNEFKSLMQKYLRDGRRL